MTDFRYETGYFILRKRKTIRIESVGGDDVSSRLKIFSMNVGNEFGTGENKNIVAPLQRDRMVGKFLTSEIIFRERSIHYHSSHCAVEHENFMGQSGSYSIVQHK